MKLVTEEHVRNHILERGSWKGYVDSTEFTQEQIERSSRHPREYNTIEMLERAIDSATRYLTNRNAHSVCFYEV
jgi:hypothetical protein